MNRLRSIRNNRGGVSGLGVLVIVLIVVAIAFASISFVGEVTVVGPNYRNAVHTYVDQAYWTNDPVAIKENLTKAVAGMHSLGLTNDMSWNFFSWDQQTSEKMGAQYGQMNNIIGLCDKATNLNQSDANYAFNYAQITTQIHNTICTPKSGGNEGNWCDEVASGAYDLNMNAFYAYQALIIVGICILLLAIVAIYAFI